MKRSPYVRPTRATVDLSTLKANWELLRSHLPSKTGILAVVKANAYGHGLVEVGTELGRLGAVGLGVADVSEALQLRAGGYDGEIFCLGALPQNALPPALDHNFVATLFQADALEELSTFVNRNKSELRIHVKVNTGMHRLGIDSTKWADVAAALGKEKLLRVEGIFTHLAESDSSDPSFTAHQLEQFNEAVALFEKALGKQLIRHAANSGGILTHPDASFDWVRPGISLYGYPPSPRTTIGEKLKPILTWRAPILQVRSIAPGDSVGYNRAFRASRPMRVATVAVGYGDGYRRGYAGVGIGFRGKRCPILGIVCMDLLMLDVSEFSDVQPGEEVRLLQSAADGGPDATELAAAENTIPYEVLTSISSRVSREFTTS